MAKHMIFVAGNGQIEDVPAELECITVQLQAYANSKRVKSGRAGWLEVDTESLHGHVTVFYHEQVSGSGDTIPFEEMAQ